MAFILALILNVAVQIPFMSIQGIQWPYYLKNLFSLYFSLYQKYPKVIFLHVLTLGFILLDFNLIFESVFLNMHHDSHCN